MTDSLFNFEPLAQRFSRSLSTEAWLTEATFRVRYHDGLAMPERFRDRLRLAWRYLGSGSPPLEQRALCLLLGRHRLEWSKRYVTCADCGASRRLPELVLLTGLT